MDPRAEAGVLHPSRERRIRRLCVSVSQHDRRGGASVQRNSRYAISVHENEKKGVMILLLLGAVYVFTKVSGAFSEIQTLVAADLATGAYFGTSVSLHGDILAVGAYKANVGAVTDAGDRTSVVMYGLV